MLKPNPMHGVGLVTVFLCALIAAVAASDEEEVIWGLRLPRTTPLPVIDFASTTLATHIESTFGRHRVRVTDQHFGTFTPTPECPTPRVWLFMGGEYRTFRFVKDSHVEMLTTSLAGDCFAMIAAVSSDPVALRDDPSVAHVPAEDGPEPPRVTQHLRRDAAELHDRLSYVVLERHNSTLRYGDDMFALYFHAAWALARHAARSWGVAPHPASVMLRTRPDVGFSECFSFDSIQRAFAGAGLWGGEDVGTRLAMGQCVSGDLNLISSFAGYEQHAMIPLQEAYRQRGDGHFDGPLGVPLAAAWFADTRDGVASLAEIDRGDLLADDCLEGVVGGVECGTAADGGPLRFRRCRMLGVEGFNNHRLCRLSRKHLCDDKLPFKVELEGRACVDLGGAVRAVVPQRAKMARMLASLRAAPARNGAETALLAGARADNVENELRGRTQCGWWTPATDITSQANRLGTLFRVRERRPLWLN